MLCPILNDRLNAAWHMFPWPSLVVFERRYRVQGKYDYARVYNPGDYVFDAVTNLTWYCVAATLPPGDNPNETPTKWARPGPQPFQTTNVPEATFKVGDRVFNPVDGNIYYCLIDGAYFAEIRNPSRFAPLPPFDPSFPLEDTWQQPMEEILGVWHLWPQGRTSLDYDYALVDDAVRVDCDPGSAWFRYRARCPEIKGDPWDAEATYVIGDQVYFTQQPDNAGTGDFYDCIWGAPAGDSPNSDPLLWRRIEIPYLFGPYLSRALHADWYELDGQAEKAAAAVLAANERLQLEFDKIERQQRQPEPWSVATR
jgi:hypothetical protein